MVSHGNPPVADDHDAFLELRHTLDQLGRSAFPLDAYETDNMIELTAEIPGVKESDIEIVLEGDILTISLEKRDQTEGKRRHFSERFYGRFQRSFQLPFTPDPDSVKADVTDGLLLIRFPRAQSERTRRIEIGATRTEVQEERSEPKEERSAIGSGWDQQSTAEKSSALLSRLEGRRRDKHSSQEEPLTLTDEARTAPAPDIGDVPGPQTR